MTHEIRFSLGNTTGGAIGACVSVQAETREEGLAQLKSLLVEGGFEDGVKLWVPDGLEDLIVYFNPDAIQVNDVEDEEDVENEELVSK